MADKKRGTSPSGLVTAPRTKGSWLLRFLQHPLAIQNGALWMVVTAGVGGSIACMVGGQWEEAQTFLRDAGLVVAAFKFGIPKSSTAKGGTDEEAADDE